MSGSERGKPEISVEWDLKPETGNWKPEISVEWDLKLETGKS